MADITLRIRTSGWVSIHNTGTNGSSVKVFRFLEAHKRHMDRVCFGDEHVPNFGTLALKAERIPAFIVCAAKHGLEAA